MQFNLKSSCVCAFFLLYILPALKKQNKKQHTKKRLAVNWVYEQLFLRKYLETIVHIPSLLNN